jgi:hypothetical protein
MRRTVRREVLIAVLLGTLSTALLAALIVLGSRRQTP